MSEYNTTSVKTVSNAIKRKRKIKRANRFRRFFKRLLVLVLVLAVGFGLYQLDQSKWFRIVAISVSNNTLYSDESVIEAMDVQINDRLWLIYAWRYRNTFDDIAGIESITLNKKDNVLMISVDETRPIALKDNQYVLSDGDVVLINEFNQAYMSQLPMIHGFDDDQLQTRLASGLALLQQEILFMISSIHQNQTTYDEAQVELLLHDQKRVYSDFRSLELLNDYPLFVDQIAPENNCVYLDYTSRSARSAPCE